jgi:hypothetical protein
MRRDCWLTVVKRVIIATIVAQSAVAAQVDSTTLRRTDVIVSIGNDIPAYNGVYRSTGTSGACGKLDFMMPHRANAFHVTFPDEPNLAVASVEFDADTLPAGATTTSFYLSVGIRTPSGGTPPAYVVRAREEPKYGEPGTAVRIKVASRDTLRVRGTATSGTKVAVSMTLICHPK